MFQTMLQVAAGGAIGAVMRYTLGAGVMRLAGPGFPWGTASANVIGSFLMGVLVGVLARKGGNEFAPFLMAGLLGGFTTFSSFSLDALTLWQRGAHLPAALYVLGSVGLSLLAIIGGLAAVKALA